MPVQGETSLHAENTPRAKVIIPLCPGRVFRMKTHELVEDVLKLGDRDASWVEEETSV